MTFPASDWVRDGGAHGLAIIADGLDDIAVRVVHHDAAADCVAGGRWPDLDVVEIEARLEEGKGLEARAESHVDRAPHFRTGCEAGHGHVRFGDTRYGGDGSLIQMGHGGRRHQLPFAQAPTAAQPRLGQQTAGGEVRLLAQKRSAIGGFPEGRTAAKDEIWRQPIGCIGTGQIGVRGGHLAVDRQGDDPIVPLHHGPKQQVRAKAIVGAKIGGGECRGAADGLKGRLAAFRPHRFAIVRCCADDVQPAVDPVLQKVACRIDQALARGGRGAGQRRAKLGGGAGKGRDQQGCESCSGMAHGRHSLLGDGG